MAQQGPLHRLSQDQNQRLGGAAAFLSGDSGDEHTSKLLQANFGFLQLWGPSPHYLAGHQTVFAFVFLFIFSM